MPLKSRDELKSKFTAGNKPSQTDFWNLIDSFWNINDDGTPSLSGLGIYGSSGTSGANGVDGGNSGKWIYFASPNLSSYPNYVITSDFLDFSSTTNVKVSIVGNTGADYTNWLESAKSQFDSGSKIFIQIVKETDSNTFGLYQATNIDSYTGYYSFDLQFFAGNGNFSASDNFVFGWIVSGDGTSGSSGNGTAGSSGSAGLNGSSGSSGANGSAGSSGSTGASGSSGSTGASGSSGSTGASGSSGSTGASGSSGSSGNGSSGSSGITFQNMLRLSALKI